jgi:two-component system LytT family response regulator
MSNVRCIIVEDEPLAAKVISEYVAQVHFLELQETFKDAILASDWLRSNTTDLIFLDLQLPKLKGMAFLKVLAHPPSVIITTAYHQYAVEGFNLSVTDYLLKPIEFERFLQAVNKVKTSKTHSDRPAEFDQVRDYLFLNMQKRKVKVMFADIIYVESQREYIKIVTTKGEYISKMGTHEMEKLLPSNKFKRIHRSFIVSLDKIGSYTAEAVEVNGVSIPIGRDYRDVIENL